MSNSTFNVRGGTLNEDSKLYVYREADTQLCNALRKGEICYVLDSKQTGKSSLGIRTRKKLLSQGYNCIYISLANLGTQLSESQWYGSLMYKILDQLETEILQTSSVLLSDTNSANSVTESYNTMNQEEYRLENILHQHAGESLNISSFNKFIEIVLRNKIKSNIVIFIDEIDTILHLNFCIDDFLVFIRSCYEERHINSEYKRLTFCLLGTMLPNDLIRGINRTPFNLGTGINLKPFKISQVEPLIAELIQQSRKAKIKISVEYKENCRKIMETILDWTGGQPFLTQILCEFVVDLLKGKKLALQIEEVVHIVNTRILKNSNSYVDNESLLKPHFDIIENRILKNEEKAFELLNIYGDILSSSIQRIDADGSHEQSQLKLSGLVLQDNNFLIPYNRIYTEKFNIKWVETNQALLRSFATEFKNWKDSDNRQKQLYLLHGTEFDNAWEWMNDRLKKSIKISGDEIIFLRDSHDFLEKIKELSVQFHYNDDDLINLIKEINYWTGGYKNFSDLIFEIAKTKYKKPSNGYFRKSLIEDLIYSYLEDFKTIQNREIRDPANEFLDDKDSSIEPFILISEYERILEIGEVSFDEKIPEHLKLKDMCFILQKNERLSLANQIYKLIFDKCWVDGLLSRVRPYARDFIGWKLNEDEIYLLHQDKLDIAIAWITNKNKKNLSELELKFIVTSLVWQIWNSSDSMTKTEAVNIILKFYKRLIFKTVEPFLLIRESLGWTITNPILFENLLYWICKFKGNFPKTQTSYEQSKLLKLIINLNLKRLYTESQTQGVFDYLDLNHFYGTFWQKCITSEKLNLVDKFLNSANNLEGERNTVQEVINAFDEYPKPSYSDKINRFDAEVLTFLNNIFFKAKAKYMAGKLDELLNSTVEESDVIEAIAIINLREGTLEYNNKEFKSKRPDVYQALFGRKDSSEALGEFGGLIGIPKALNTFGEATKYGTLEYSMFYLTEGIIVVYFMDLPELRAAICFIATKEAQLGSLVRQCRKKIDDIKKELDKQFA
jgi:hypothetical protein